MTDERMIKEAAALDEATDHVIREMTQVNMSDDAVSRVMARISARTGEGATGAERPRGGWFDALWAPRIAWSTAAATAALAAIVATGLTLVAVRSLAHDNGSGSAARGLTAAANGAATAGPTEPTAPVVTPQKHGLSGTPASGSGLNQSVGAAMVMTPDEDPPPQQRIPPLPATAVPQDIKLDVTITDQAGTTRPITKTVSMVVADREAGSIESETRMPFPPRPRRADAPVQNVPEGWDWQNLPLNVHIWPTIMADGHVRVKLTLSYRTAGAASTAADAPMSTAVVTKNLIAVVTDGKPLVVSTSADAATDRKVTVEVKATIQK
jgi:hypothetical protein